MVYGRVSASRQVSSGVSNLSIWAAGQCRFCPVSIRFRPRGYRSMMPSGRSVTRTAVARHPQRSPLGRSVVFFCAGQVIHYRPSKRVFARHMSVPAQTADFWLLPLGRAGGCESRRSRRRDLAPRIAGAVGRVKTTVLPGRAQGVLAGELPRSNRMGRPPAFPATSAVCHAALAAPSPHEVVAGQTR
jgi:hypothetical protein